MKYTILVIMMLFSFSTFSSELLSPKEKQTISSGALVKRVIWKKGFVWPQVLVYVLLKHTPAQNMSAFSHFDTHKTFIPDMLESRIVKKISPEQMHVYFEMKIPWPINKSTYTTNNVITQEADGSHKLTWNLVKSDMLKSTEGHMKFIPYEGKTLLEYDTFIVPNSSFAGMFKNRVETDVENSVKKIVSHLNQIQL